MNRAHYSIFRTLTFLAMLILPAQEIPAESGRVVLAQPEIGAPVTPYRFTGDVRNLPAPSKWKPGDPIKEIPRRSMPGAESFSRESRPVDLDPLLSLQQSPSRTPNGFTTPGRNFAGTGFTGVNPPDTNGDVGPNHYIQTVNMSGGTQVKIWDKATPTPNLLANFALDSLGSGVCASGFGDPIVLYDRQADRWLMAEFSGSGNHLCVYVSQSADPVSGGWNAYNFTTPNFPDYPKYAVWPTDANGGQGSYVVTTNEDGPVVYALPRGVMLSGSPASFQRFSTIPQLSGFPFAGTLAPADVDGPNPPPSMAAEPIIQHRDTEVHGPAGSPAQDFLEVWEFDVDWNVPANTTLTLTSIPITEIDSDLCGLVDFACFAQPGTGTTLDPLREPVMNRLQYINHLTHQTLVGDLVTDVNGLDRGGIRWFELRGGPGSWSLFQEGTYSIDSDNRWIGGIAMDGSGNIALGYNVSSTTQFPSIRYTGRMSTDASGSMSQPETAIINGSASNGSNRWGDYASMSLDPSDDCTFWYTNMYNASSSWNTRVASFRFDQCGFAGSVFLTETAYTCSSTINIQVADANLVGAGTQNVTIWSTTEPPANPETVTLNETPPNSGILTGSIQTTSAPVVINNGVLSVSDGDTITVHYVDADDGAGNVNVPREASAQADCASPVISNTQALNVGASSATISWNTNEAADSYIVYDTMAPPAIHNTSDSNPATSHSVPLTGLAPCTQYFFFVKSTDGVGNQAVDDNGGNYYTFTTTTFTTVTIASVDIPKDIPDQSTITSTLPVPDNKQVLDANVQLNIAHSFDADLDISLISPGAVSVQLSSDNGGTGDNYTDTILDDEAATAIASGGAPFAGSYRPEGPLSAMDGTNAQGTWTLQVTDDAKQDTGLLNSWSLTLVYPQACGSCPPITLDDLLPDGTAGIAYTATITATGGAPAYNFVQIAGNFPPGLTLNSDGTISGTPTTAGTFNFDVTATDSNNCTGVRNFSVIITGQACIFNDDFADGIVDWQILKPNVTETGGNLVLTPASRKAEAVISPAFSGCSTCAIHTNFQTAGGAFNKVWILGWYADKNNSLELLFKEQNDRVILKQRSGKVVVAKMKAQVTIVPDTVYDVVMAFDGTQVTVSIDGTPVITMTPVGAPSGTSGFRAKNTTASFGSICIQ